MNLVRCLFLFRVDGCIFLVSIHYWPRFILLYSLVFLDRSAKHWAVLLAPGVIKPKWCRNTRNWNHVDEVDSHSISTHNPVWLLRDFTHTQSRTCYNSVIIPTSFRTQLPLFQNVIGYLTPVHTSHSPFFLDTQLRNSITTMYLDSRVQRSRGLNRNLLKGETLEEHRPRTSRIGWQRNEGWVSMGVEPWPGQSEHGASRIAT